MYSGYYICTRRLFDISAPALKKHNYYISALYDFFAETAFKRGSRQMDDFLDRYPVCSTQTLFPNTTVCVVIAAIIRRHAVRPFQTFLFGCGCVRLAGRHPKTATEHAKVQEDALKSIRKIRPDQRAKERRQFA